MPGPALEDADDKCRRGAALDAEFDSAAAGVLNGVAGDLGSGGGDPRLVELGKTQERGDLPRPLPGQHDVDFDANLQIQEGHVHGRPPSRGRATRTVTSSRPRLVIAVEEPGDQARVPPA